MRRLIATAAVTTLAIFATACGDDDEPRTAATEAPAADDEASEATTDDGEDTPDTEPDVGDVPALGAECEALRDRVENIDIEAGVDFSVFAEAVEDAKELTPDEIDDDLDKLAEAYDVLAEAIAEAGDDPTAAFSDPDVMEIISDPDFAQAGERVSAWFEEACPGFADG